MASIRVTPETLNAQGKNLVKFATEIDEVLAKIDSEIGAIIDGWDGFAQDAYYDMYSNMKSSLEKFPELVNALGEATVSAAEAFASVDEQLRDGFKSAQ